MLFQSEDHAELVSALMPSQIRFRAELRPAGFALALLYNLLTIILLEPFRFVVFI